MHISIFYPHRDKILCVHDLENQFRIIYIICKSILTFIIKNDITIMKKKTMQVCCALALLTCYRADAQMSGTSADSKMRGGEHPTAGSGSTPPASLMAAPTSTSRFTSIRWIKANTVCHSATTPRAYASMDPPGRSDYIFL